MRTIRPVYVLGLLLLLVLALVLSACQGWSVNDPNVIRRPTSTPDPLHYPALKPTDEPTAMARAARAIWNGIRCDLDQDNDCDAADSILLLADRRATRTAPKPTNTPKASPQATSRATTTATRTASPAVSPTATRTPTGTPTASASITPGPTFTPGPTATPIPPTEADCLNCLDPKTIVPIPAPVPDVAGLPCPAWAHDVWRVTGLNGKLYRTWHPPIQPASQPGAGCYFDHAHGTTRDPRQSNADPSLPAYGFDADLHGMAEPHAGFKTDFANKGDCNDLENFCSTSDLKLTVHMGTAGKGRLTVEMHTFIFDMIGHQGSVVHVRGMASTGDAATQCDPAPDTSGPRGFRLIAMPQDQAKPCNIHSPYEVWQFHMVVGDNVIISKFANFDGITVGRFVDGGYVLEPTSKTWPNGPFSGCRHDVYYGGFTLNRNHDAVDMHGVRQYIKLGQDQGRIVLDTSPDRKNTYKRPFDGCGPVAYSLN